MEEVCTGLGWRVYKDEPQRRKGRRGGAEFLILFEENWAIRWCPASKAARHES